jgi:hypothetical protein
MLFLWLMNESDRPALESAGWREAYRHAIYDTPLMVRSEFYRPTSRPIRSELQP